MQTMHSQSFGLLPSLQSAAPYQSASSGMSQTMATPPSNQSSLSVNEQTPTSVS